MNTFAKLILAAVLMSAVAGCGIFRSYSDRMSDIHAGMTPGQVENVMGRPDMRSFDGNWEEWQYYAYLDDEHTSYMMIEIGFEDGKVRSMNSYRVDKPVAPPRAEGHHPSPGVHVEVHSGE